MNSDRGDIPHGVPEERRRREFLRRLTDDFAALRSREGAWHDEIQERLVWNHTLADDLESEQAAFDPRPEPRLRGGPAFALAMSDAPFGCRHPRPPPHTDEFRIPVDADLAEAAP